jgi:DNA-binding transcriptional LysR family regulator
MAKALAGISLDDLAQKRLIHLESDRQNWTTWTDWFQKLGYTGDLAVGSSVTSYSVALQLAQKGAGLALGWRRLVQPLLKAGKLAAIGTHTLPAPHQFYLVELSDGALSANASQLKDWILAEVHEGSV